jgi:SAM-dependent methyltransferase
LSEVVKAARFFLTHNPLAFAWDCARIWRLIDHKEIARIRAQYSDEGEKYSKYLRPRYFLLYNLFRCYSLGLQRGPALRILDLGCGAGYFAYVCAYFGHEVKAIDVADFPVFNEMVTAFKVRRAVWRIKPLERIPQFSAGFDVITAFRTTFNLPGDLNPEENTWGRREWAFLLDDLVGNHLRPGGRIYLHLNRAQKHGNFYDSSLLEFFRDRAESVDQGKIVIRAPK